MIVLRKIVRITRYIRSIKRILIKSLISIYFVQDLKNFPLGVFLFSLFYHALASHKNGAWISK